MQKLFFVVAILVGLMSLPKLAYAHCDTMDGPVVQAGLEALDTTDVDLALIWVQPANEAELRAAFTQASSVRKLGSDAQKLADRYFLETLVRLHRAGEGEPYTGIKPSGETVEPVIAAADAAIVSGSPQKLTSMIVDAARGGIKQRLASVVAKRKYKAHDVRAGRAYVAAYVGFVHYVEQLHAAAASAHGAAAANGHEH